jgi:perosamine synthetase
MYSFGTIKTCTAFGGSLCVVRNNDKLFHLMRNKLFKYVKLSKQFFIKRVLKNLVVMSALSPIGNYKLRTSIDDFNFKLQTL